MTRPPSLWYPRTRLLPLLSPASILLFTAMVVMVAVVRAAAGEGESSPSPSPSPSPHRDADHSRINMQDVWSSYLSVNRPAHPNATTTTHHPTATHHTTTHHPTATHHTTTHHPTATHHTTTHHPTATHHTTTHHPTATHHTTTHHPPATHHSPITYPSGRKKKHWPSTPSHSTTTANRHFHARRPSDNDLHLHTNTQQTTNTIHHHRPTRYCSPGSHCKTTYQNNGNTNRNHLDHFHRLIRKNRRGTTSHHDYKTNHHHHRPTNYNHHHQGSNQHRHQGFTRHYGSTIHQQGPHRRHSSYTHGGPLKNTPRRHDINPGPATVTSSGRGVREDHETAKRRWLGSAEDGRNISKRHLHPASLVPSTSWYPFNMPWPSPSHHFSGLSLSPQLRYLHQVHQHHKQMMARLHQHMLEMNGRVASLSTHRNQHYNSHSKGKQRQKQQLQRWRPNSHQTWALLPERSDHFVQHRDGKLARRKKSHNHHPSPATRRRPHQVLSSNTKDHQRPRGDERRVQQFKISRGLRSHVPEDVEVFRGPKPASTDPPPHNTTTAATTTTTTTTTPRHFHVRKPRRNCTSSHGDQGAPTPSHPRPSFHHSRHRLTSSVYSSNGGSNYKPTGHYLTHQGRRYSSTSPSAADSSSTSNKQRHRHFSSWLGVSPSSHSRADAEGESRIFSPSVKDHLQPSIPPPRRDDHSNPPCIKCPPDTRVEAPRGRDCVYAHTPSPFSCTSGFLRPQVVSGPRPGQRLQEGHYVMVLLVVTAGHPLSTCTLNYDVTVRKCGELPSVPGLRVWCTAGRAWGSHCTFRCDQGLRLQGHDTTSCTHRRQPRWSSPPPKCAKKPEVEHDGCSAPAEAPGGHYKCHTPVVTPASIPIPKDDPQAIRDARHASTGRVNFLSYPEGTVCKLECETGWTVLVSHRGRRRLTCTPGAHWDQQPPLCYRKVAPALSPGECEDQTLSRSHSPLAFMPLPAFTTASGVAARVTCLLEVETGGRHVRTCTAQDPELETTSTCTYTVTVPGEYRDPDVTFVGEPSGGGVGKKPTTTAAHPRPGHADDEDGDGFSLHEGDEEYEGTDDYSYEIYEGDYGDVETFEDFGL